jgi:hypothetical protein
MQLADDELVSLNDSRKQLERELEHAEQEYLEAKRQLVEFDARTPKLISLLQRKRAERHSVVTTLWNSGLSSHDIAKQTGLLELQVETDIDYLMRTKVITECSEGSLGVFNRDRLDAFSLLGAPSGPAASRSDLKAASKRFLQEGKEIAFLTTSDNNHRHKAKLDKNGDGSTTPDNTGHEHRFCMFMVINNIEHLHGLTLDLLPEPK